MKIKLIVAVSENNVIGIKNGLPWHLPDDMVFFKNTTMGGTVIMGRNNYLSIPEKFRPLKNRFNIVLTSNSSFTAKNCLILNSLESAINFSDSIYHIVSNYSACPNKDKNNIFDNLSKQMSNKVKWTDSIKFLEKMNEKNIIEIGPGKVLSGLIKRISSSFTLYNFNNIKDIEVLNNVV